MEIQFQYMALCHYSLQVRKYWKSAVQKQSAMETAYSKERKQRRQLQSELQELKQRIETLEKAEARLKKWEERRPVIDRGFLRFSIEVWYANCVSGRLCWCVAEDGEVGCPTI